MWNVLALKRLIFLSHIFHTEKSQKQSMREVSCKLRLVYHSTLKLKTGLIN